MVTTPSYCAQASFMFVDRCHIPGPDSVRVLHNKELRTEGIIKELRNTDLVFRILGAGRARWRALPLPPCCSRGPNAEYLKKFQAKELRTEGIKELRNTDLFRIWGNKPGCTSSPISGSGRARWRALPPCCSRGPNAEYFKKFRANELRN